MKTKLYFLPVLLMLLGVAGCRNDVDFNNVDLTMGVNTSLGIPVGNVTVTMGDFLGSGQVPLIVVDADGIFHAYDTFRIATKEYHHINLSNYIMKNDAELEFAIADRYSGTTIAGDGATSYTLSFPMQLGVSGINDNVSNERLDSMLITLASFTSTIKLNDFDLRWSEIKSVTLLLGDQFTRASGKEVNIPVAGKNFEQEIPINIEDFYLCLMQDKANPGATVDKINFEIRFEICPEADHPITVNADSKILYDLNVKLMEYKALWGYFEPSAEMSDVDRMTMDSIWDGWQAVKKVRMRFLEPKVTIAMTHKVAAPLYMVIDYVKAVNSQGVSEQVVWTEGTQTSTSKNLFFTDYIFPDDPFETSKEYSALFDYQEANGHLDKIFDIRPDTFLYSFHLEIDKNKINTPAYPYKQLRITDDRTVPGYGIFDIPFKFNTESEAEYVATIATEWQNINFDSIAAQNEYIDSLSIHRALAFIEIRNSIPFEISGRFHFFDKDSLEMDLQFIQGNDSNYVQIDAPRMNGVANQIGYVSEPSRSTFILDIDSADFNRLSEIKYLNFDAYLGNNPMKCQIDTATSLTIQLGVAANAEAILNFNKKEKGGAQ